MVESEAIARKPRRSMARRIVPWFLGGIACVLIGIFIVSFFLDGIIRPPIEAKMNASLKDYHAILPHAHLQLLGFTLTLRDLTVVQLAQPRPPVAAFPIMRFQIHWKALLFGRVVASVLLEAIKRILLREPQPATDRHLRGFALDRRRDPGAARPARRCDCECPGAAAGQLPA
jgi:hypothetical protein